MGSYDAINVFDADQDGSWCVLQKVAPVVLPGKDGWLVVAWFAADSDILDPDDLDLATVFGSDNRIRKRWSCKWKDGVWLANKLENDNTPVGTAVKAVWPWKQQTVVVPPGDPIPPPTGPMYVGVVLA